MTNRIRVFLPLIIAIAVVAGILIGRQMKQPPAGNKFLFSFKQNQFSKINDIIQLY
jgi:hypothetical protein